MSKRLTSVLFAISVVMVFGTSLRAQVHQLARAAAVDDTRAASVHPTGDAAELSALRLPSLDTWRLASSGQASTPAAAGKKQGRKAMWILLGASAAIVTATVMLAPGEAPIPASPSSNYRCTMFYRPGTLMTTSGYTCVSR